MTLAEFLLARIAEDEARVYRADSDGEYRAAWLTFRARDGSMDYTSVASDHRDGYWCADGTTYGQEPGRVEVAEPFFDAARVLAECQAKRQIIELHQHPEGECWEMHRGQVAPDWKVEWDGRRPGEPWAHPSLEYRDGPCETLQLLALPYVDHPDYREAWAA